MKKPSGTGVGESVYAQSKRFVLRGIFMLALGSVFLLACKLLLDGTAATAAAYAGGGLLLWGNGLIIYGVLVFAGSGGDA